MKQDGERERRGCGSVEEKETRERDVCKHGSEGHFVPSPTLMCSSDVRSRRRSHFHSPPLLHDSALLFRVKKGRFLVRTASSLLAVNKHTLKHNVLSFWPSSQCFRKGRKERLLK